MKKKLIVFFDAEGVIRREFVPERQKVNAEFYVSVLDLLLKRIRRVRTAKFQSSEWFLLHNNAPSHNAAIVQKFLANRIIAVLHHPPYSPDLAPALRSLPQVQISLKRAEFSNSGRNSVCSDKGTYNRCTCVKRGCSGQVQLNGRGVRHSEDKRIKGCLFGRVRLCALRVARKVQQLSQYVNVK